MATTNFTITLDTQQFEAIKQLVAAGRAPSVSAFVKKAIATAMDEFVGWQQMLDQMLEETGGPLTDAERAWADEILGHRSSPTRRKRS